MSKWLDHSSIVGHLGKYGQKISDPLSWVTGGKWADLTSDVLPEKVNSGLSTVMQPFEKVDKTINPVRRIPIVNRIGDIVASKPGDAAAIAAGAFFGGSALMAGAGGGAAGGGGAVAAGGEGTAMGGSAGTLGAVDSSLASSELGLSAVDIGGVGAIGDGTAMGGAAGTLGAADSSAASGELGLTAGDVAPADEFVFNPAQDSQLANVQNDLPAQTSDDTSTNIQNKADNAKKVQRIGKLMQQMGQQQERDRQAPQSQVRVEAPVLQNPYATSTKTLKTGPTGNVQAAMARGAAGGDAIDSNGVQAAAIQEISKRLVAAKKRLAQLQGAKQ